MCIFYSLAETDLTFFLAIVSLYLIIQNFYTFLTILRLKVAITLFSWCNYASICSSVDCKYKTSPWRREQDIEEKSVFPVWTDKRRSTVFSDRSLMCFQSALSCVRRTPHKPAPRSPQAASTQKSSPLRSCTSLCSRRTALRAGGCMVIAQAYSFSIFDRDAYPSTMGTVCLWSAFSHQKGPCPHNYHSTKRPAYSGCAQDRTHVLFFIYFHPGGKWIFHTHTLHFSPNLNVPRDRSPVRTSSPRQPSGKYHWNQWSPYNLSLLQNQRGTAPPDWAWFLPRFFFFLRSVTDGVLVPCRCCFWLALLGTLHFQRYHWLDCTDTI